MASNQELTFTCCETVNKLLTASKFQFLQQENECNNINNIDNSPALLGVQKRWSPVPRTHNLNLSQVPLRDHVPFQVVKKSNNKIPKERHTTHNR